MTIDEKINMLHGTGMMGLSPMSPLAIHSNGGAGYVLGIPRLGIPAIQMSDAAYGVRSSGENGRYSTALPSDVAGAASWDLDAAYEYGALIGRELRAQGYNMTLGGGVNLTREPRNGRTFEYLGEDPVLAGKMVGSVMKGLQAQHVIGDIKHYALNDQESGRNAVNITIDKRAARESDLLAFEIGSAGVRCGGGDVLLQPPRRRLRLREQVSADRRSEERLEVQGIRAVRLGRHAQRRKGVSRRPGPRGAGWIFYGDDLKKAVESGKIPAANSTTTCIAFCARCSPPA